MTRIAAIDVGGSAIGIPLLRGQSKFESIHGIDRCAERRIAPCSRNIGVTDTPDA